MTAGAGGGLDSRGQIEYKRQSITAWNELAPRYHKRWTSVSAASARQSSSSSPPSKPATAKKTTTYHGPFQATGRLVRLVGAGGGDAALDVACGTGVVTRRLAQRVGRTGHVVGTDMSMGAISVARRWNRDIPNVAFVNADAENLSFLRERFDVITCQYALFFFPNAVRALKSMKARLKDSGTLGVLVHGHIDRVPFYGSILGAVTRFIPDYIPPGTLPLDRYSTKEALGREVGRAGFSEISVSSHTLRCNPGSFEEYWGNYLRYVTRRDREKLDALTRSQKRELRQAVRENTKPYTDRRSGAISFPWEVLILTARH